MNLCVVLWAVPGREQQLIEYEDEVLPLLRTYDARVVSRVRSQEATSGPFEVHLLEFPSTEALDGYMADPARQALASRRDAAIARTEIVRVDVVEPGAGQGA